MANDDLFAEAEPLDDAADLGAEVPAATAPAPQQPVAPQQPRTQKPRSNVYTMMLILSLAAIVTSCVVLYLYLDQYGDYPYWDIPQSVKSNI